MQLQTPVILTIGLAVAMAIAATTPTALHSVTSALSFQNKYSYCDWRTGKAGSGKEQCVKQCAAAASLTEHDCQDSICRKRQKTDLLRGSCRCYCHQPLH
ncbi:hypothetical protein GTA08_BOTSDO09175 [Botryosphaeria dothidea]|uniref:Uncharacterized protein n=1 Tax=Botryosphaeria dothidea TaxID=55169 RepID=A0A8H4ILS0_9PEZI|nr:hypothetical protein GTA08_BOTSDO09175 [Botryosphaeria dothidea]